MAVRLSLALAFGLLACAARADEAPDFVRDVRPILSRNCFKCHGPDDKARKARLRLDDRDAAVAKKAIVPGKPSESELVARITAAEEGVMPPPSTKLKLTDQQKDVLRRWIAAGAEYKQHWSFVKPHNSPIPDVAAKQWPRNPIDHFILQRLEKEGLKPSPEADPYTLIRRVSLDLIGLPPTPEEVHRFAEEYGAKPQVAYEALVDRLLASPHYGERWARRWLDLARYADTNGYEKDRQRSIWPYRDWVINALNADMPFDRFTVEQLAGDLLPDATLDQRIATGFHRNTMLNEEGGIDPLEFRFHAMTDRVATTGTTWLGLTVGCAQCHTHKFDPISHREYYQFFAFLNNADEPEIDLLRPEVEASRAALDKKIADLIAALPKRFPADKNLDQALQSWLEGEAKKSVAWNVLRPVTAKANLPLLTVQDDASVLASGDMTKRDIYDLRFEGDFKGVKAIRLEALPDDRLPKHGPGRIYYEGPAGDFHLSEVTLKSEGRPIKIAKGMQSFAAGNANAAAAIDGNPQTGWGVNGGQGRRHVAVFTLAEPLGDAQALDLQLLFERYYAAGLGRFRIAVTKDEPTEARDWPTEAEEALSSPADRRTEAQRDALMTQFLLTAPELKDARAEIDALKKQRPNLPTTLVLSERPPENPRPTFIHNRGEFLQPTEQVEAGIVAVLPPLPPELPRNRLGLARWLVSPDHPLTARVAVNRQWAAFFGKGLVRTSEDFGIQGEAPTHPELLDWLALEFVRQGWSMKAMHRLIVTSATYRQSSRVTPDLITRDADNRLLARGPRLRLEAETVRDAILTASGQRSPKVGGPSVFPPQPASVTTEGTYGQLKWTPSEGPDRYRRGLYTFAKRTAPFAMAATFDGPSGEACVARRDVSNSPLQALTLLNDVVVTEAAQELGRRLAGQGGTVEERLTELFHRCLVRPPSAEELAALRKFFEDQKTRLDERTAWLAVARVLFNLDEFITRN